MKNEQKVGNKHAVADYHHIHLERFGVTRRAQVVHSIWHGSNPKGRGQVRIHVLPDLTCLVEDCSANLVLNPLLLWNILTARKLFEKVCRRPLAINGQNEVVRQAQPELDVLVPNPKVSHLPLNRVVYEGTMEISTLMG